MASIISFQGVQKHFKDLHVLQDIDLEVQAGEVLVVFGPSGSGKSTLIRTVNRLERIDGGQLLVLGQALHDPRPANLRTLAARNGGQFPADKVRRIIDGREQPRAHGGGDMPVWGHEYSRALAGQGERKVQENLDNLVEFLETIQE